jgi:hypothetical protein
MWVLHNGGGLEVRVRFPTTLVAFVFAVTDAELVLEITCYPGFTHDIPVQWCKGSGDEFDDEARYC